MIFQLNYLSDGKFDGYFEANKQITNSIDYTLFGDKEINDFLMEYGYYDLFHSKQIYEPLMYAENAIRCDLLRLLILYELGGVYIDADVSFTNEMLFLESDLFDGYGNRNVVLSNRSLYFIKGIKHSKYIKNQIDLYINSEYLHLDVMMNTKHELTKFHKELMIVPNESLFKYFTHNTEVNKYDF